jgi:hypothetical protein
VLKITGNSVPTRFKLADQGELVELEIHSQFKKVVSNVSERYLLTSPRLARQFSELSHQNAEFPDKAEHDAPRPSDAAASLSRPRNVQPSLHQLLFRGKCTERGFGNPLPVGDYSWMLHVPDATFRH